MCTARLPGSSYEYVRNKRGRLGAVLVDGAVRAAYGYDWAGRRIWREARWR